MLSAFVRHFAKQQWNESHPAENQGDYAGFLTVAQLAESHDPETSAHVMRVQHYSRALAVELAGTGRFDDVIDEAFIRQIEPASLLHDIGKSVIPDAILRKPGELTEHEYEIVKTHTTVGPKIIDMVMRYFPEVDVLVMARKIAAYHHERFDGTGYPYALEGDEIPLCARIVALTDVYDALTSKRVYKAAFTHGVARGMIVSESGRQFDPAVVAAFLSIEDLFQRTYLQFAGGYSKAV